MRPRQLDLTTGKLVKPTSPDRLVMTHHIKDGLRPSVVDFLRAIHPDNSGCLELRAFYERGMRPAPVKFVPLPLTAAGLQEIQEYAATWTSTNNRAGRAHNVYHAIATRKDTTSGRLENCTKLWALYIEIDFKHVSVTEALAGLQTFELPPSYIVHSGGGLHAYWVLSEPLNLTVPTDFERARQWLGDLALKLHGEPESAEPARVLRVPDTVNVKVEYGLPHPNVALITEAVHRYSLADIVRVLGDADPKRPASARGTAAPAITHDLDVGGRIQLAKAWLDRQPPAVEGQSGDTHTFRCCATVAIGHDLDEKQSFSALQEWNARCLPPWTYAELKQKIRNAIDYGSGQRGSKLAEFPTTEAGDAEFFADLYASEIQYDHRQIRWLVANPVGLWEPDPVQMLNQMVIRAMRLLQKKALAVSDDDRRKHLLKWAIRGENRSRITNTLAIAQSVPLISDRGDNWDLDPMVLGVPNGVVDLRTGALRPARLEERISKRTSAKYNPSAICPLWERTVAEIFNHDPTMIRFIQRALGYSITGDLREECFFLCWGDGANGKGTLINTVSWLLQDYADNLAFSAFELHKNSNSSAASPDIAKLVGRRLVTASESGDLRLDEAKVKNLTGRDPITARFLYKNEFTFQPTQHYWLSTNRKPVVRDPSNGFWRRMHLVPFTQSFEGRANQTLKDALRQEAEGILVWLVQGALVWLAEGLNPPASVKAATEEYRKESNQLGQWLEARCDAGPQFKLQSGPAFKDYKEYCQSLNEPISFTQVSFGKEMSKQFPPDPTNSRHTVYCGVRLRYSRGTDTF